MKQKKSIYEKVDIFSGKIYSINLLIFTNQVS